MLYAPGLLNRIWQDPRLRAMDRQYTNISILGTNILLSHLYYQYISIFCNIHSFKLHHEYKLLLAYDSESYAKKCLMQLDFSTESGKSQGCVLWIDNIPIFPFIGIYFPLLHCQYKGIFSNRHIFKLHHEDTTESCMLKFALCSRIYLLWICDVQKWWKMWLH